MTADERPETPPEHAPLDEVDATETVSPTPIGAEPVMTEVGAAPSAAHEDDAEEPPSLWRNGPYMALLTGETVGNVAVEIAQVAWPIIAITYLAATELEIGILGMAEGIAFLILSLPVGAWVDRVSRRKVMAVANVVRALTMAAIPTLWLMGLLEVHWLMVIALTMSAAQVFFDMAYMSIVPSLVPEKQLSEANSRLQMTNEVARAAGPGLGGVLARVISAPLLPIFATVGYLVSALAIWRIPADEPPPREHDTTMRKEIADGLRFVFQHPFIRPVVVSTTVSNFFSSIAFTMFPVLVLRYLEVGPLGWGLLLTAGSIGGILGALAAPWFARTFGDGHSIAVTYAVNAVAFMLPVVTFLVPRPVALGVLAVSMIGGLFAIVSFNVVQVTMRQKQCPPRMIGRMTASIRVMIWGIAPLGALISGVVAEHWGLAPAFWIGGLGNALGLLLLVRSPLWRMGEVPVVPSGSRWP
ncbi:MFS transporter [Demequina zhanjiangensis]|uniref:MFS transporter n=1 Tax=Demequina zhanjiangensis TaxID=3051659 RepID=A0ABT8G2R2_9MICO|nr:MFS transporter [Demequina sp. SYSU T00b26]MDN4472984.1 MFS transporter [Demequina sp. SYSU T00b26]